MILQSLRVTTSRGLISLKHVSYHFRLSFEKSIQQESTPKRVKIWVFIVAWYLTYDSCQNSFFFQLYQALRAVLKLQSVVLSVIWKYSHTWLLHFQCSMKLLILKNPNFLLIETTVNSFTQIAQKEGLWWWCNGTRCGTNTNPTLWLHKKVFLSLTFIHGNTTFKQAVYKQSILLYLWPFDNREKDPESEKFWLPDYP